MIRGSTYLNDMHAFDLDDTESKWKQIKYANTAPCPRIGHTAVVWGNSMIIFGGYVLVNEKYQYSNEVQMFSFETLRWTSIKCSSTPPCERMNAASVIARGKLIIFGGKNSLNEALQDLWELDLVSFRWTELRCNGEK